MHNNVNRLTATQTVHLRVVQMRNPIIFHPLLIWEGSKHINTWGKGYGSELPFPAGKALWAGASGLFWPSSCVHSPGLVVDPATPQRRSALPARSLPALRPEDPSRMLQPGLTDRGCARGDRGSLLRVPPSPHAHFSFP